MLGVVLVRSQSIPYQIILNISLRFLKPQKMSNYRINNNLILIQILS